MGRTVETSYGIVGESHNYMGTPRRTGEVIDITGWGHTGDVWPLPSDPDFLREQAAKLLDVADEYESRAETQRDREAAEAAEAIAREERKVAERAAAIAEESAREAAEASRLSSSYKGEPVAPAPTFSDPENIDPAIAEESEQEVAEASGESEAPVTTTEPSDDDEDDVEPRDGDGDGNINDGKPNERPSNKTLGGMTNAALKSWMDDNGVEYKAADNKGELIKAIKASTRG